MPNQLDGSLSLYLRQHAHQPVNWAPFGKAAFAEARERDVPVFLSVGYAACHWCHVMAHESFDDPAIAAYLNAHFVPVKVDREELPEVDAVYMNATQALSGEGGWPMSVFTLPDGRAFHAGTYFPPVASAGRPSFGQLLQAVTQAWTERRRQVTEQASRLARGLGELTPVLSFESQDPEAQPFPWGAHTEVAVAALATQEAPDGGFGKAPKFPPSAVLRFLVDHAATSAPTSAEAGSMAARTLAVMSRSALRDVLDGGFCRYSVTSDFSVPHFEKMLPDQALLLDAYAQYARLLASPEAGERAAEWASVFPAEEAREVASGVVNFLKSALLQVTPEGLRAFASGVDADSGDTPDQHEREGAHALWTPAGLTAVLGAEAGARVAEIFTVGERGTVSALGSPLHAGRALSAEERGFLQEALPVLRQARSRRPQPAVDDKIVASWNALTVTALALSGKARSEPDWVALASEVGQYLRLVHWNTAQGTLSRTSRGGLPGQVPGGLDDYAAALEAALTLYQATGNPQWWTWAQELNNAIGEAFVDTDGLRPDDRRASGNAALTAASGGRLPVDAHDSATPAGAATLASAWLTFSALSGDGDLSRKAQALSRALAQETAGHPRSAGSTLLLAARLSAPQREVALMGDPGPARDALEASLWASAAPGVVRVTAETAQGGAPFLNGRTSAHDGGPRAFVCRGWVCDAPVSSADALLEALRR